MKVSRRAKLRQIIESPAKRQAREKERARMVEKARRYLEATREDVKRAAAKATLSLEEFEGSIMAGHMYQPRK